MSDEYCNAPECEEPVDRLGFCASHRKQFQRTGRVTDIAERVSPEERLILAADALAQAGDNDEEYERCRRAAISAAKTLGKKEARAAIAAAMLDARLRGVRLGRPPKIDITEAAALFDKLAGDKTLTTVASGIRSRMVAAVLGVSERTVRRAIRRLDKKKHSDQAPESTGPRVG